MSQHLGILREAGLVTERRQGTRRLYLADRDQMARLRDFLDDYWTSGLERLRDAAEAAERDKQRKRGDTTGTDNSDKRRDPSDG